jgi:hypothetical protein
MLKSGTPLRDIAHQMSVDIINKVLTGPFVRLKDWYLKEKNRRTDLAPNARTLVATAEYVDAIDSKLMTDGEME